MNLSDVHVIDVDTHIIEPTDLWTSRLSGKWGDLVPHVAYDQDNDEDVWVIGDQAMMPAAMFAAVDHDDLMPEYPRRFADVPASMWDPRARLRVMDENHIHAQVIYPNLVGVFFAERFVSMHPALALACVEAYNDFVTEFCSVDPDRLIGMTAVPFWDVDASVRELARGKEMGHRGLLFAHTFERVGLPNINDRHWDRLLAAAQDLEQSVNFHIGFAAAEATQSWVGYRTTSRQAIAADAPSQFLSNVRAMSLLTTYGVCERFPRLKFVCVESGFGYVPFVLQAVEWHWENNGVWREHPHWLRPIDYFKRQMYATFWFEQPAVEHLEEYRDNVMWETDFPHPSAQWPTAATPAPKTAADAVAYSLGGVSEATRRKVLHDTAATVYHLR